MTMEAVTKFFEKVAADPALRQAVRTAAAKGADSATALVELGSQHDCLFTVDDFNQAASVFHQQMVGELNDAQLDDVAGGPADAAQDIGKGDVGGDRPIRTDGKLK